MSFFQKALNDLKGLEQELLGPDYAYYKQIRNPKELGMSSSGGAIARNIGGLISYTQLLVTGGGNASKPGGPLGDKFFLKTGATCTDKDSGEKVTRSLYFNNIPDGSIPFISQGLGTNFSEFRGLVPGTLSNMNQLNPMGIFSAFMQGTNPECRKITMPTRDVNNINRTETAYMATSDINNIPACWFSNGRNPISGDRCSESFTTMKGDDSDMPEDPLEMAFFASLGLVGLYIIMRLTLRK